VEGERESVAAYAVFHGSQAGGGGPVPPTGKRTASHCAYVMEFEGDRVRYMTKIWNDGDAMKELGWA
jgi:predicted ester cyclase